ncbi:GDSL-type esterase/lipase family protein [Sphingomonas oligophenolica]|uniref:GDSL-type esterase/lipase family protein n=1 Tax=Sphingomonas oligophenolica TaxID=301154 RepID=A0ABU9Y3W1_9SPHN
MDSTADRAIERGPLRLILDRTAVLLLGTIVGGAIGWAFQASPGASASAASVPAPVSIGAQQAPGAGEAALMRQYAGPFQQLEKTIAAGGRVRVGVFGDSFGDGVWWGMAHQLPSKAGFDVVKFSQPATGFTRYKSLNLETRAAEQLGDAPLDIAIISFGANDAQGIITPEGKYAKFMGPLWQQEVGGRIDRFVELMRRHHAMVYWVGLPRMARESFDSEAMAVNAFYAARVTKLGVPFIDTRPLASDAHGQFAAYLDDPKTGKRTLIRAPDGIHMSMAGYLRITHGLADRIRTYTEAARTVAGTAPSAATAS